MIRKKGELKRRLREAQKALKQYPAWVRVNNYFQGGENLRATDKPQ